MRQGNGTRRNGGWHVALYTCDKCHQKKMATYRPDIKQRYQCDEPIDELNDLAKVDACHHLPQQRGAAHFINNGTVVEFVPGAYRVEADGKTVIVFKKFSWWHVRFKSVEIKDYDLATAARRRWRRQGLAVSSTSISQQKWD